MTVDADIEYNPTVKQPTLCWSCQNATGGCSWTEYGRFEPVDGWDATPTLIRSKNEDTLHVIPSYLVNDCPEYIPDPKKKKEDPKEWLIRKLSEMKEGK